MEDILIADISAQLNRALTRSISLASREFVIQASCWFRLERHNQFDPVDLIMEITADHRQWRVRLDSVRGNFMCDTLLAGSDCLPMPKQLKSARLYLSSKAAVDLLSVHEVNTEFYLRRFQSFVQGVAA